MKLQPRPQVAVQGKDPLDRRGIATELGARIAALDGAGIDAVRRVRREFSKRLARSHAEDVVRIAHELIASPAPYRRFVAYELVQHHRAARASLDARSLATLGRGIASWDQVDTFALYLAGPAWREGQVPDALIHRWVRSRDRWWRRAALVSTVALNSKARGGSGDARRTVRVCTMLFADRDDMVVKAMSWALRELAKRDPAAVRGFLGRHQEKLAPRALREVRSKLATGLKNPRPTRRVDGTVRGGGGSKARPR